MNRVRIHLPLALALLLLAIVVSPLFAAAAQQGEPLSTCGVRIGDAAQNAAQMAQLLLPAQSAATRTPDFTLSYIGQCCINNDAALCPTVPGYTTVHCAFPMCGSGGLSCV